MRKHKARSPPKLWQTENHNFHCTFPSICLQNDGKIQSTRGLGSVAPHYTFKKEKR